MGEAIFSGVVVAASVHARARATRLALAAALGLAVALMLRFDLWHCPVAELLGVPCPGCGLTRAAFALATGDVGRALGLHPLAPVIVPWLAMVSTGALLRAHRGARGSGGAARPRLLLAIARASDRATPLLLVLLVGVWIARFFGAFGGPVPVASHLLG